MLTVPPKAKDKHIDAALREAQRQGWTFKAKGNAHVMCFSPHDWPHGKVMVLALLGKNKQNRTVKNQLALFANAGIKP